MTVQKYEEQVATFGVDEMQTFCRSCRNMMRFCIVVLIVLLVAFQGMSYFVALDGGYDGLKALIIALIPLLGPLFCGFQLALAGVGYPLIIWVLFIPCALTLFCAARYHDEYAKALKALHNYETMRNSDDTPAVINPIKEAEQEKNVENPYPNLQPEIVQRNTVVLRPGNLAAGVQEATQSEKPLNQHAATSATTPPPAAAVVKVVQKAETAPSTPSEMIQQRKIIQQPSPIHSQSESKPPLTTPDKPAASEKSEKPTSTPALKAAEEEYNQAMQDVLSLLNKNKS